MEKFDTEPEKPNEKVDKDRRNFLGKALGAGMALAGGLSTEAFSKDKSHSRESNARVTFVGINLTDLEKEALTNEVQTLRPGARAEFKARQSKTENGTEFTVVGVLIMYQGKIYQGGKASVGADLFEPAMESLRDALK